MRRLAILAMTLPIAACGMAAGRDDSPGITATGSGNTRSYAAAGFTGISLAGADDVQVTVGPAFAVRAEGASEDLDRLRIRVDGDTLKVDRRKTTMGWTGHKVRVLVAMPRLEEVSLAGSGNLAADRVEGRKFEASLAGSGSLALGAARVEEASFDIAGSGSARAAGTAKALDISIAGSGRLDAPGLRAEKADVSIAGSGSVRATVAGPADVSMMGSGDVDLGPGARCKTSKMGSGSVRCG